MENKRPSTISPSGFAKLMTKGRGKDAEFGQTAISYAEEIVQLMMGVQPENFVSYDMQRGIDTEPLVVAKYEQTKMVEVYGKERYYHPKYEFISGEPDGLVGKDGIIEVKCPNQNNHFKNLLEGAQISDYKWQIQGYMWLLDRKWVDFCSFNQDYPEKYQLSINRVLRDDAMIAELSERCVKFWHEIVEPIHEKVKQL